MTSDLGPEALAALRALLQERCRVPPLPPGWGWSSAMLSAEGLDYGGDFFVAEPLDLPDGPGLQMVLVDMCGSGERALPAAVELAGALRGLIGVLPYDELMAAANTYLNRLEDPEAIATAVQVVVCFATGRFEIRNAGHPPALRWDAGGGEWAVDTARGMALGVQEASELDRSEGVLADGEALLFYTDGVVETRTTSFDEGVRWLRDVARSERESGWPGLSDRLIAHVSRGADDRAVLLLGRVSGI
jgi:serine phosphatase RsbU (regulator of sigma subunit)